MFMLHNEAVSTNPVPQQPLLVSTKPVSPKKKKKKGISPKLHNSASLKNYVRMPYIFLWIVDHVH